MYLDPSKWLQISPAVTWLSSSQIGRNIRNHQLRVEPIERDFLELPLTYIIL